MKDVLKATAWGFAIVAVVWAACTCIVAESDKMAATKKAAECRSLDYDTKIMNTCLSAQGACVVTLPELHELVDRVVSCAR